LFLKQYTFCALDKQYHQWQEQWVKERPQDPDCFSFDTYLEKQEY